MDMDRRRGFLRVIAAGLILAVLAAEVGWLMLGTPAHRSPAWFQFDLDIITWLAVPSLGFLVFIGLIAVADLLRNVVPGRTVVIVWAAAEALAGILFFVLSRGKPDDNTVVLRATAPFAGAAAWIGAGGVVWLTGLATRRRDDEGLGHSE
jgi:hypothetical protein